MTTVASPQTWARRLTPEGSGGVAVVRVEGPDAVACASRIFRPRRPQPLESLPKDRIYFGAVHDEFEPLDDAIVAMTRVRRGIRVDINLHGSVRVVQRVLLALGRMGVSTDASLPAVPPWPIRHRIEADAHAMLERTPTRRSASFLLRQTDLLFGCLTTVIDRLRSGELQAAADGLRSLLLRRSAARFLCHGIRVALVGLPNAGKSTLANRILGQDRVLTSAEAGTTRDWVEWPTAVEGVALSIVDTAGLRETAEDIERQAIDRGLANVHKADVHLWVVDGAAPRPPVEVFTAAGLDPSRAVLAINKSDVSSPERADSLRESFGLVPVSVSALTGTGVASLLAAILNHVGIDAGLDRRPTVFTPGQAEFIQTLLLEGVDDALEIADKISEWLQVF